MGKNKVWIGVWETTDPDGINLQKDKIIPALQKKKEKEKMDYMFFAVVDIVKNNSYLYIIGKREEELVRDVFGIAKDNILFSKGTVSRKKQLVPPLMNKLGDKLRK